MPGEGKPLLVAHNFGAGRVLAFAGDSTWHWWMRGFEAAHKRFWRQIVLWLARKDQAMEGNVWVRLEKRRFAPASASSSPPAPSRPAASRSRTPTTRPRSCCPTAAAAPWPLVHQGEQMAGSFRQTQAAGDYADRGDGHGRRTKLLGTARARFTVFPQDLELDNASADASAMESLAAMTGGAAAGPGAASRA